MRLCVRLLHGVYTERGECVRNDKKRRHCNDRKKPVESYGELTN